MSSRSVLNGGTHGTNHDSPKASPRGGSSNGKHSRRPSGSSSRRNSLSLPPPDLPQAEAAVLRQLTDAERQQLVDGGEAARYVKACNGNEAEVCLRDSYGPSNEHANEQALQAGPRCAFLLICTFPITTSARSQSGLSVTN